MLTVSRRFAAVPLRSARARLRRSVVLVICAGFAAGCGGDYAMDPAPSPPTATEPAKLDAVALEPSQAVLSIHRPGQFVQLALKLYDESGKLMPVPGGTLFSADVPGVAAVNGSGRITAIAPGSTTISVAVTVAGVTKVASMQVTVEEPPLETLTLDPTEATLIAVAGQRLQMTASAHDVQGSVIRTPRVFASDAPTVAKVSNTGLVEVTGPGVATITVSLVVGGITHVASTVLTVARQFPLVGVYDLVAAGTSSDWDMGYGDYQYTATLGLEKDPGNTPGIAGTFPDLRMTWLDGSPGSPQTGFITSTTNNGFVLIHLAGAETPVTLTTDGDLTAREVRGTFVGLNLTGTFVMTRRD